MLSEISKLFKIFSIISRSKLKLLKFLKHSIRPLCTQRACTMKYIQVQDLRGMEYIRVIGQFYSYTVHCVISVECNVLDESRSIYLKQSSISKAYKLFLLLNK